MLILALTGAFKGRDLPLIIPQVFLLFSTVLLLYRGFFAKSRLSLFYTATIWLNLAWIAGIKVEQSWGSGFFIEIPFYFMLISTPLIAYIHQRIYRRINPVATRGLKIEPSESPINLRLIDRLKKKLAKEEPKKNIELITFDLGAIVKHENR